MTRQKIFVALGTRPEAIKLAPLILAARKTPAVETIVCNTGQHQSMAGEMLSAFGIESDVDLNVMKHGQTLTDITTAILSAIEAPLRQHRPDWLVVQGDTTTSFAAALAAFYLKIPVAHVEAGLRTGDRYAPWPEEINRRLNSVLATLHFAPTAQSRANLLAEGVTPAQIEVTGNTGIDALMHVTALLDGDSAFSDKIRDRLAAQGLDFLRLPDALSGIVIVTAHRRENFGAGIESICRALVALGRQFPKLSFVLPVHPNPEVGGPVDRIIRAAALPNVYAIKPVDYFSFAYLLKHAPVVITDSGGLQEEASALGKKLVVLRDVTERVELVGQPGVWVVGADEQRIISAVVEALRAGPDGQPAPNTIFGDGSASRQIVTALRQRI
jgi:UDP-N-acetylglucosamine 2-epimerase